MAKPWKFPVDVNQWRNSETRMQASLAARGLYLEMMFYAWTEGSLPADPAQIAKIVGAETAEVEALLPQIKRQFRQRKTRHETRLIAKKVEEKREQTAEFARKQSRNRRKSESENSLSRKELGANQTLTSGKHLVNPRTRAPTSTSTSTSSESSEEKLCDEIFETLVDEHCRYGSNSRPNMSAQMFQSQHETLADAQQILAVHRERWQPAWRSGRQAPDLDNWLRDYDPQAAVKGFEQRRNAVADMEGV